MTELFSLGFRQESTVRAFLKNNQALVLSIDAEAVRLVKAGTAPKPWLTDFIRERVSSKNVFLTYVGLARTALINQFPDEYRLIDLSAFGAAAK